MPGKAREFAVQIDAEMAEVYEDVKQEVADLMSDGLARAQQLSPVHSGQFRANWLVTVGQPSPATQEGDGSRFWVESTFELANYPNLEGWPIIYLQNNLPYASRLEDGYSKQAPYGILSLVVAELSAQWGTKT